MWLWFKRRATSDMYLGTYRDLPTMPSDGISSRFQQAQSCSILKQVPSRLIAKSTGEQTISTNNSHHLAGTKTSGFYPLAYVVGLALK